MKQQWKVVLNLIVLIIVAIFALQNTQRVVIHFFLWEFPSVPLVLVIFMCLLIGAIIGAGMSLLDAHENRKRVKEVNHELAQTKDLHQADLREKDELIAKLRDENRQLENRLKNTAVITSSPSDENPSESEAPF